MRGVNRVNMTKTMTEVAEDFVEWLSQVVAIVEEHDALDGTTGYMFYPSYEEGLTPSEAFILFDAWRNGEAAL